MKLFTCLLVFRIFDITAAVKSKSVNLALETVLEFNNRDNSGDVQFINNVQTFLDKIKTIINKNQNGRRSYRDPDQNFTEFLKHAIAILKSYDDEDLEDVFAVIDNEIRKYHYKGCQFYELIQNNDVRRYMAVKLNDVRSKSAEEIRYTLKQALTILVEENYDSSVKDFLDYINSLYRSDAKYKFRTFLNNLENYKSKSKRANLDLIKIVREGVRSILFDHYTDLNLNARRELKLKVETFWKELSNPQYIRHKVWNIKYTKSSDDQFGKIDVETIQEDSLNASLANNSTTRRPRWNVPQKLPFNVTVPKISSNKTATDKSTTEKKATTAKTKKTKKPKPKKPKLKKLDSNHDSDEKKATRYKHERSHRPHRYRTRGRERLQTLWEEELVTSAYKPIKTITSNHEAEIKVEKTERPKYHKKHDKHRNSKHKKPNKKFESYGQRYYRRYSSPKFRVLKQIPVTSSFRKFAPYHVTSEEGLTIESFEAMKIPQKKFSFRKSNDNDTFGVTTEATLLYKTVDNNVMRRINDLEREVHDMKSIIKINEPITTTGNVIEDNYALDFWEGTPASEYTTSTTTTIATTNVSTTKLNEERIINVTEVKLLTVLPVTKPKNIFIPVSAVEYKNVSRGGAVSKKASFTENNTKVVPFLDKINNDTISVYKKNDLFAMTNNITSTPALKIEANKIQQFVSTLEKNVTDPKMFVDENIRKKIEDIFKNYTSPYSVSPPLFNVSLPPGFEMPFDDIDNLDFL